MNDTSLGFNPSGTQPNSSWSAWIAFAVGSLATLLLVHIGVARPAAEEMTLMRHQIMALEKSISAIAGQRDSVDETNHLLSLLSQQQSHSNAARKTLLDLRELNTKLLAESSRAQQALIAVHQLATIKDKALASSDRVDQAGKVLGSIDFLHDRLIASAETNQLAHSASRDLLAMKNQLLDDSDRNYQAHDSLRELIQMRTMLGDEAATIEAAQDRVDGLIALKDSVLAQTDDLSESIETLEITDELSKRFRSAARSFQEMRNWMMEVVAMEPTLLQIQRVLAPMADFVNLKRMDPKQLREFARSYVLQSSERLATTSSQFAAARMTSENDAIATPSSDDTAID